MDKLAKALAKMSDYDRRKIKELVKKISDNDLNGLDLKKLAGRNDIYRVRQGDWRIIFRLNKSETMILAVERKTDTTYNF